MTATAMAPSPCDDERVEALIDAALRCDTETPAELALSMLDDAVPFDHIVARLLIPAQLEAGDRWHRGTFTVADEHLVTTATTAALEAIAAADPVPAPRGIVVVACAEGEWHALPARLFAERLRRAGWGVALLGASTPAEAVGSLVDRLQPTAVAVSCSVPLFLAGTARIVDAAHARGVPVLAGGRAVTAARGRAIGADAAPGGAGAAAVLDRWLATGAPLQLARPALHLAALEVDILASTLADEARPALEAAWPAFADYDAARRARTLEDLAYIARFAAVSHLVGDPTVWSEFCRWQLALLSHRGVPAAAFDVGVGAMIPVVRRVSPAVAAVLAG